MRYIIALAIALAGCATVSLPQVPTDAPLSTQTLYPCEKGMLTVKVYDTNPATEAALATVTNSKGDVIMVVIVDDAGVPTMYIRSALGNVRKVSKEEWEEQHMDPCGMADTKIAN